MYYFTCTGLEIIRPKSYSKNVRNLICSKFVQSILSLKFTVLTYVLQEVDGLFAMESLTKQREIVFSDHLAAPKQLDDVELTARVNIGEDQAKSAVFLLADVEGVLDLKYISDKRILITYDIRSLTLNSILTALNELGFELDESLISRLKHALIIYTEDTLRENLGISNSKQTRDIFMGDYQRRAHGCRDLRSIHWRRYL